MKSLLLLLAALLFSSTVLGQSRYVTDDFEVMVRTGPSVKNKIIASLKSGARVEVLRDDAGNGHSQVRTSKGEIGYILKRFLSNRPAARSQVAGLEAQLAQLRSKPGELQSLLADSQEENKTLIEQNMSLTDKTQSLSAELNKIKEVSGDVIALSEKNRSLKTEVQQLLLQLDDMRIQNEALKDNSEMMRNLVGAGILLVGLFLGWILSRSGRRNRGSWGN